MMIRISITPYFNSVTCGENKDTLKSSLTVLCLFLYISGSSHLVIEIQVYEAWDALGELSHFSHCLNGARLTAVKETQLQLIGNVAV